MKNKNTIDENAEVSDEIFQQKNQEIKKEFVDPVLATSFGWWLLRAISGACVSFFVNKYVAKIFGMFKKETNENSKQKKVEDDSR